ncbi:MAG: ATP-binding protein [Candidatus Omnitrophica bacterium]|nr:ATP-binding protein [Candidatus Omnitrophota bacterium]MDD5501166.1 ATP-binding protein [Candidatus Omnitrophota bacterium]
MIISIASGKGGTGKTTVSLNLALSLNNPQFLDCDVEEPNAHLFLKPSIVSSETVSVPVPEVDESKCTFCGKCAEVCAYHAIAVIPSGERSRGKVLVFPNLCHGCGSCGLLCPCGAIKEAPRNIGTVERGVKGGIDFIHGSLNVGEAMSVPLIRRVKEHIESGKDVVIDAPPGTSCPMIAAVKGSDFCILVSEPTPFGLNDFVLAVEVLRKLKLPFGAVINRSDIGDSSLEDYCGKEEIPVLMRIPFSRKIAEAYSRGEIGDPVFQELRNDFRGMHERIRGLSAKGGRPA